MSYHTDTLDFLEFSVEEDLKGQGQLPPLSVPPKCVPICMVCTNLVIPAQNYDKLLCRRPFLIIYKLSQRQTQFPGILSGNDENEL